MASQKTIIQRVWELFYSLKLTIFLFIILAAVSIIGTVISQNASPAEYLKFYKASTYKVLEEFGLLDMYHSWWFVCLLILLCLNLLICSIKNFPRTWKTITRTKLILEDDQVKTLPFQEVIKLKLSLDQAREHIVRTMKKYFRRPQETVTNEAHHFFAEKGKYSRIGVYLTHCSILIVLGGALIGSFFGFKGFVNISEGQTVNRIILTQNSSSYDLGFKVRCDNFEVTYYPNGAPKDYKSTVTVLEGEKEVLTRTIEVNHPLQHQGIVFYQASYGTSLDHGATITLLVRKKDGKDPGKEYRVEVGESFTLPEEGLKVKVNRFVPDFGLGENKVVFSRTDQPNNPAVELLIFEGDASAKNVWIFQRFPDFHGSRELPYGFLLRGFEGKEYTGLQVAKDPGVWVVWIGCVLLVVGILFAFFLSHFKVWVRIRQVGNRTELVMAGTASKNRLAFEKEFNQLKADIQKSCQRDLSFSVKMGEKKA